MTKWTAAERAKAALRHAETCPNVTGSTTRRGCPKASVLVLVCSKQLVSHSSANDGILRIYGVVFVAS